MKQFVGEKIRSKESLCPEVGMWFYNKLNPDFIGYIRDTRNGIDFNTDYYCIFVHSEEPLRRRMKETTWDTLYSINDRSQAPFVKRPGTDDSIEMYMELMNTCNTIEEFEVIWSLNMKV